MDRLNDLGLWLERRKWGICVLAGVFLIIAPFTVTYILWAEEWDSIKKAYSEAWEAFKSGEA